MSEPVWPSLPLEALIAARGSYPTEERTKIVTAVLFGGPWRCFFALEGRQIARNVLLIARAEELLVRDLGPIRKYSQDFSAFVFSLRSNLIDRYVYIKKIELILHV